MPAIPVRPVPRPRRIELEFGVFSFSGGGETPQEAADEATGRATEWLAVHQWRNGDGQPAYSVSCAATEAMHDGGLWYTYTLTFYGPTEETTPLPERGYTGKTERLG